MLKGVFLNEEEVEEIEKILDAIDLEVGSAITFKDEPQVITSNMNTINRCLKRINDILGR